MMETNTFKEDLRLLSNRKTCNNPNAERAVKLKKYIQHLNKIKSSQCYKTNIDEER